jgi:transcription elongation factor GreA
MKKQYQMTTDGIAELEAELKSLVDKRSDIAERIKTAREFGDLAENAEYSAARQDQEKSESRIAEIEYILKNVEEINTPKKKDVVELGNAVELESRNGKKKFTVVGSVEANPLEGKVSNESPIGKSLMGKKVGDEIEIVTPAKTTTYKIITVS